MSRFKPPGFTLIELLLATGLFAILAVSFSKVVLTFTNQVTLAGRSQAAEAELRLILDRIRTDLLEASASPPRLPAPLTATAFPPGAVAGCPTVDTAPCYGLALWKETSIVGTKPTLVEYNTRCLPLPSGQSIDYTQVGTLHASTYNTTPSGITCLPSERVSMVRSVWDWYAFAPVVPNLEPPLMSAWGSPVDANGNTVPEPNDPTFGAPQVVYPSSAAEGIAVCFKFIEADCPSSSLVTNVIVEASALLHANGNKYHVLALQEDVPVAAGRSSGITVLK